MKYSRKYMVERTGNLMKGLKLGLPISIFLWILFLVLIF